MIIPRTPRETPRPIRMFLADLRSSDDGEYAGVLVLLLITIIVVDVSGFDRRLSAALVGKETSPSILVMEDSVACSVVVETVLSPTVYAWPDEWTILIVEPGDALPGKDIVDPSSGVHLRFVSLKQGWPLQQ